MQETIELTPDQRIKLKQMEVNTGRLNPSNYCLGKLCKENHDFDNTGFSVKRKNNLMCLFCERFRDKKAQQKKFGWADRKTKTLLTEEQLKIAKELYPKIIFKDCYLGTKLCPRNHEFLNTGKTLKINNNCPDCMRIRAKELRVKYPDRVKQHQEKQKRKYFNNHEESKLKNRQRYAQKKALGLTIELNKEYYLKNQERIKKRVKEWKEKNKDKVRYNHKKHKNKRKQLTIYTEDITQKQLDNTLAHFSVYTIGGNFRGFSCAYCQKIITKEILHWDHLIPLKHKGHHAIYNLVPACSFCNISKGAKDPWEWFYGQEFSTNKQLEKIQKFLGIELLGYYNWRFIDARK